MSLPTLGATRIHQAVRRTATRPARQGGHALSRQAAAGGTKAATAAAPKRSFWGWLKALFTPAPPSAAAVKARQEVLRHEANLAALRAEWAVKGKSEDLAYEIGHAMKALRAAQKAL